MFIEAQRAYSTGDFDRALKLASKVPATDSHYPNARYLAALALVHMNDPEAALGEARKLASDFPNSGKIHHHLATLLYEGGFNEEAEISARHAARLAPQNLDIQQTLGIILDHNGWQAEAQHVLKTVSQAGGKLNREATFALLRNTILLGDMKLARSIVSMLSPEASGDAELLNIAARIEFGEGHIEKGTALLEKAKKTDARNPDVLADFGYLAMSSGDTEESSRYFRQALKLDPTHPSAHFFFTHMGGGARDGGKGDDREQRLQDINAGLEKADVPYLGKIDLGFAAGKINESLKHYDQAFEDYDKANKMVWDRLPPEAANFQPVFDRVKSVFNKEFMQKFKLNNPSRGSRMIFIVGMPRSGTTLLEQTLSGCPVVDPGGESGDFDRLVQFVGRAYGNGRDFPEAVEGFTQTDVEKVADEFLSQFNKGVKPGQVRTSKDMRLFLHLGLISILFPGAKIIHSRRNPLDTCLSAYFQFFKMYRLQFCYNLSVLGGYYRAYVDIMNHWKDVLPVDILEVDYETMVADHENEARRVVEFCELEWNDACLNFQDSKNMVKTASIWQVRQGIYQSSTERWRRYENHLSPLIESLGDLVS